MIFSQDSKHLFSKLGDSRNRSVPCAPCRARGAVRAAWNICGHCDEHCSHAPRPAVVTTPGSDPAPTLLGGVR